MSIKHLEYLKVKDSKLLVVEVRPIRCLLDTPSGPTYTDKWMEHSHWKELHHHLLEVVEEYEEQRAALNVECNKPKCKSGRTLQIGYMFRPLPQCWCSLYFLTPRNLNTWTDDGNGSGDLQDKGGRYEDLVACGEMLVVSVTLSDLAGSSSQSAFSQNSSKSHQQASTTNKLMKALGSKMENTISDYFKTPEGSDSCVPFRDTQSSKRILSSGPREGMSSAGVKTLGRLEKENESGIVGESVADNWLHTAVNAPKPLCLTEGDCNPQEERIKKNDDQLQHRIKVKKLQLPKKTMKAFTNLKQTSLLDFKSCTGLSCSESELRNVCSPAVANVSDKKVNVHGNLNKNSKTSEADSVQKTKEDFRNSPHKNLLLVLDVTGKYNSDLQVKAEVDSESENHDEFRSYEGSVTRDFLVESDGQQVNVECGAQNMNGLDCSQVFVSGEENRLHNVLYSASVSQRKEVDDVGGNVSPQIDLFGSLAIPDIAGKVKENTVGKANDCEQYMLVDGLSYVPLMSRGSSRNASEALSCNSDMLPSIVWQENIDTDSCFSGFSMCKVEMNAGDESFHGSNREYEQQNYRKREIIRCSSNSENAAENSQYSSERADEPFLHKRIKEELVESEHNSHAYSHSSMENEDNVQKRIHQNQDREMCSGKEEHDENEEPQEDWEIFYAVRKIPVEVSSQKKLISPVNNHEKSVRTKTAEGDTASLFISSNRADIQSSKSGEGPSEVSKCDESANCVKRPEETRPSRVTVKYTKSCRQVTQKHSDLKASVPGCQNSCQLGKKHSREKVKVKNYRNMNSETSPELRCLSTGIEYPSRTEESLHSARDTAMEGNEKIHPTEILLQAEERSNRPTSPEIEHIPSSMKYLSGAKKSCSAEDSVIARNEEAQCTQVFESENSFSSEERTEYMVERQVASDLFSYKHHLDVKDTFEYWCRSQNASISPQWSPNGNSQENRNAEFSFVSEEGLITDECLSPSHMCDHSPVLREEPVQYSALHVNEEEPLLLASQKSPEKNNLVGVLRSMKFLNNRHREGYGGSTSESEWCEGRQAEVIQEKKKNLVKRCLYATPEFSETQTNVLSSASDEKNNEFEKRNSYFRTGKESFTDSLAAHHNSLCFSSGSAVEDSLKQENHRRESRAGCSTPQQHQTCTKTQKDVHKAAGMYDKEKGTSKVGKKKKEQSNISSFFNRNKKVQSKRVYKVNSCPASLCGESSQGVQAQKTMAQFSQDAVGCEVRLDALDEEYIPEKVLPKGMKGVSREFSSPNVRTNEIYLFKANDQLLLTKKAKILARDSEESDHSVDHMEENLAESFREYTGCVSSKIRHVSNCLSAEDLQSKSLESEQVKNLRRSTRIKRKVPLLSNQYSDINNEDVSESECSSEVEDSSPQPKKLKENAHKFAAKDKERKGTLKQKKMVKYLKEKSPVKKRSEAVQCKNPYKESSREIDENKGQDDTSKPHLLIKKKVQQRAHKTQEVVSKPSTSKHFKASCSKQEEVSKTQGMKKNSDLNYYNELWNFSLGEEGGKKYKQMGNTIKQKSKKSSPKKDQRATSSGNHTKEKQKGKDTRERNSKSDMENCAPDHIDDDFYWKIQAEVEQLNAIVLKDVDDLPVVSKTNSSSKMRNGRKSREEECQVTNVVEGSTRSLDSLRNSYRQLQNMTNSDLEQRLEDNIPYLEDVIRGNVPNERHQWFKQCNPELMLQQDYLIYGPFTSDQSLFVLELLKKKLSHMDNFIGNSYELPIYRCRVLVPTFFTKIVMDNENVTLNEAYKLMTKFSLNQDIAVDLQHSDSRKF
ncbi:uncharacterized protein LOC135115895 isoform X1 [Scylla paramamosain]|uniref:uncharacterized protein LOC135115895 isoform X1 n=3 Tax=Scylla paramamosain TaxID=85552 RepID=UPI0030837BFA